MQSCPMCNGTIEHTIKTVKYTYKAHIAYIKQPGSYCVLCEESYLSPDDEKATKIDIVNFEREVDNLLTTDELTRIRKNINLTEMDAAKLFGDSIRAFHKYEAAEETQSKSLDILLRLIDMNKITLEDIKKVSFS